MDQKSPIPREVITITYRFKHDDGSQREFQVKLDKETLTVVTKTEENPPNWTKLKHCKCPNCPLEESKHRYCPVALNLSEVIHTFEKSISHEKVDLTIETEERSFLKRTTLQRGIGSLMGIYMTTSGCPVLDKLRPMVRHHLPFANMQETQYRALSMYLLAQYFLSKKGKKPDWDLKDLKKIYDEISIVNKAFSERFKSLKGQDSIPNAMAILDTFASNITFSLDKDSLGKIENLFAPYLNT